MTHAIDLSFWKYPPYATASSWDRIKNESDIKLAILGVTERNGIDASFEYNYTNARRVGISVGAYKFSYAENTYMSKKEAEKVVSVLAGRPLDTPIFLDLEWEWQSQNLSKGQIWNIIEAFRDVVLNAGYEFGIYANMNWYNNYLPDQSKNYPLWLASYPFDDYGQIVATLKPNVPNLICWQYSQNGAVPGIYSSVDCDIWYGSLSSNSTSEDTVEEPAMLIYPQAFDVLRFGDSGDQVQILQKELNDKGFDLIDDGIFGTITYKAVMDFQSKNGIARDGVVGPITWSKLLNPSLSILAGQVIGGMWGNGEARKNLLEQAGYDYDEVQAEVNKLLEAE